MVYQRSLKDVTNSDIERPQGISVRELWGGDIKSHSIKGSTLETCESEIYQPINCFMNPYTNL